MGEEGAATKKVAAKRIMESTIQTEMRRMILEEGRRIDGRSLTDIRPISSAVGFYPELTVLRSSIAVKLSHWVL